MHLEPKEVSQTENTCATISDEEIEHFSMLFVFFPLLLSSQGNHSSHI